MIKYTLIFCKGLAVMAFILGFSACTTEPNSPGVEYMPDMYRSPSIEPYVDYGQVRGEVNEKYKNKLSAKIPPKNNIQYFGADKEYVGMMLPYHRGARPTSALKHGLYGVRTEDGAYEAAAQDENPIPYSKEVLEEGKDLYTKFCQHCHGAEGKGQGAIAKNGAIQGIPDYAGKLKDLPEGKIFYSITYGKGLMGSHASLLNKKERWIITHYVQVFQNGGSHPDAATKDSTSVTTSDSTSVAADSTATMASPAAGDSTLTDTTEN